MRHMVFAVLLSLALSAFTHAQEPPPPLPPLIHPVTGKVEWTDPFVGLRHTDGWTFKRWRRHIRRFPIYAGL